MSLKIIHTADWHLGQTFFGYDRDEEHEAWIRWNKTKVDLEGTDGLHITWEFVTG
jgi:exonuclease SbcD